MGLGGLIAGLVAAATALAACAPVRAPSQFLPSGRLEMALPQDPAEPRDPILLIYTQGTLGNRVVDTCDPAAGPRGGGQSVPRVLVDLAERNPDIFLWANCTYAVGAGSSARFESNRLVPCRVEGEERTAAAPPDDPRQTKLCLRVAELRALVRSFLDLNPRLRPERIFLAGNSGGAWSSLLALRGDPTLANAVVGFAPAFLRYAEALAEGSHGLPARPPDWTEADRTDPLDCAAHYARSDDQALCRRLAAKCNRLRDVLTGYVMRCRQLDWLADPARGPAPLPALIYAFRGDPHESPETLAPFSARPGLHLVTVPAPPRSPDACAPEAFMRTGRGSTHRCAHRDWFRAEEYARIERFVRCRVADPRASCAP